MIAARPLGTSLRLENVDEDDQEHEVDEVHSFNETDGQEEVCLLYTSDAADE